MTREELTREESIGNNHNTAFVYPYMLVTHVVCGIQV